MSIVYDIFSFVFAAGILLLTAIYAAVVLDSLVHRHDLPTSRSARRALIAIIRRYKPGRIQFYDLGSAHGSLVLMLKKQLPDVTIHAVEKNIVRITITRIRSWILGRGVVCMRSNIFDVDLRDADVVYTYLWFDLLPKLEEKFNRELKSGALVVANTSTLPTWVPVEVISPHPEKPDFEKLFVYVKK
jgi:hypothetical protein